MFHFLTKGWQGFKATFFRVPIETRLDDQIYEGEIASLEADHNAEHWIACSQVARERLVRLKERRAAFHAEHSPQSINLGVIGKAATPQRFFRGVEIPPGFTQHEGVSNPLPGILVTVRFRDGTEFTHASDRFEWHWNEMDLSESDVIAYRGV